MLIKIASDPAIIDWEEATHRFEELDALLRVCEGIPNEDPLVQEYLVLREMLDTQRIQH